jgi:hypothetical protein
LDLKDSQYQAGLRLLVGANDALQHVGTCLKRHEEASRIRRGIEELEGILKKMRRELGIG